MRRSLLLMILISAASSAQPIPASHAPSDDDIRKIIAQRVDAKQATGIVVGVIEPAGRRVVSYGALAAGDPRPLNGDTVFEIGSITKGLLRCCFPTWSNVANSRSTIQLRNIFRPAA